MPTTADWTRTLFWELAVFKINLGEIIVLISKMATENFEMNGDADRNGETEVRKGNTGARYKGF